MTLDSYTKDIANTAQPENLVADTGTQWKFAREVIVQCPSGNSSPVSIGSRERQEFEIAAGEQQRIASVNRAGQSLKLDLSKIWVSAGTNGDDVTILLIDPSED